MLRNRTILHQALPAVGSDFRDRQVRLCGFQVRSSLLRLLVDFGRIDVRQQLVLFYPCANIEIPALQIPVRSCVNRSIGKGLRNAWQHNFICRCALAGKDHADGRDGPFLGLLLQPRFGCRSRVDTRVNHRAHEDDGDCGKQNRSMTGRPGRDSARVRTRTFPFLRFRFGSCGDTIFAGSHCFSFTHAGFDLSAIRRFLASRRITPVQETKHRWDED